MSAATPPGRVDLLYFEKKIDRAKLQVEDTEELQPEDEFIRSAPHLSIIVCEPTTLYDVRVRNRKTILSLDFNYFLHRTTPSQSIFFILLH